MSQGTPAGGWGSAARPLDEPDMLEGVPQLWILNGVAAF